MGTNSKFLSQPSQRRTLPSSFQSFTSEPSERGTRLHGGPALSQQKESRQVKPNNGSEMAPSTMANYRGIIDHKLYQHTQKRTLPPSLQQSLSKTASEGPIVYKGNDNFCNFIGRFCECHLS